MVNFLEIAPNSFIEQYLAMNNTIPTSELIYRSVARYFEATRSNNARQWASCFSANAVVEDPVGTTPIKNLEAILQLGETFVSAFETVGLHEFVHVVGNEAAARWTGRGLTKEGKPIRFEGINIFEFDEEGKIVNLKGYWNPDKIIEE